MQPVRGTHDILPDEFENFHKIIETARNIATLYGFREMATPIFEQTEVFARSMGETSDVVSKEMFTFATKGGESVTLRPEFTAGTVRAFISGGMQQHLPLKLFSCGQVFRYERPQKGRQRQFHQVNFEWLGDDSWVADAEIITLAGHLLSSVSKGKGCTLLINTLGDKESRAVYRTKLVDYLNQYVVELSEDSRRRLEHNPLRILDSKDAGDRKILEAAPVMTDYLSDAARERFDRICNSLQSSNTNFFQDMRIEPALVRGLDYYTDTVFEFTANTGDLGAQNTVLAGGRYDGLVEQMGGRATPSIGFAAGVERLLLLQEGAAKSEKTKIVILPFEEISGDEVLKISTRLRYVLGDISLKTGQKNNITLEVDRNGKLSKRLEKLAKNAVKYAVILSPDEFAAGKVIIKDMFARNEYKIAVADLDSDKIEEIFSGK